MTAETQPALPFPIGSKVRILDTREIGTVIGYPHVGPNGKERVLVDRPYGNAGQATRRQTFDASALESAE